MKTLFPIALAAFVLAPMELPAQAQSLLQTTAGPLSREHWQRTLQPPVGALGGSRCVVLDAEIFAHAAAGLRDVRLLQGTRELQYAVDESHDDRETTTGQAPADDRSIFDIVGVAPFSAARATFLLPAHVPVERIALRGGWDVPVSVVVSAMPLGGTRGQPEVVRMVAAPGQGVMPVTLGANLQHAAEVTVSVSPATAAVAAVVFEMRRRELCYKPLTDEPVRIVYGDPEAKSIRYDYALQYKPTATPVLATMGPRESNPAYAPPVVDEAFALTLKQKLGIAIGLCVGMLVVTLGVLFRFRR